MKSKAELIEMVKAAHKPELIVERSMVYQVWEDGEVTLQKAGELFNQRNLHLMRGGSFNSPLSKDDMPVKERDHGYAVVEREDAVELHNAITGNEIADI